ncbi:MAG: hypothetical protein EPN97_15505 [Alphaproteobacteria bacterium]|nr:MAG: hypothetical protein EPN97_15505 [Alphaproteobacteria bacterium]
MKKTKNRKWLLSFLAAPVLAGLAIFWACTTVLNHAGEYASPDDIIDRLTATNGVYGPAVSLRVPAFRQRLYERVTPKAVAIGSPRIDQIQADDFSVPFINFSGAESLDDLQRLCTALSEKSKPELLILAVDFWWFLGDAPAAPEMEYKEKPGMADILKVASWYMTGELQGNDTKAILSGKSPNVGIGGILHGDGYDRSGAYVYASLLTGAQPAPDSKFEDSLGSIAHGEKIFRWGDDINATQWQKFTALLDFVKQHDLPAILLLPPVAPDVLDAMAARGKYGYIEGLRLKISEAAASYRLPLFDDHDIRFADGTSCEFIGGAHGGAVVYKRVLLDMAVKNPGIREKLNLPGIGWGIEHFKGQASTRTGEKDFLNLGCKKTATP